MARGWTVREFAGQARLNICSVYNAMHGKPVRDGTTIRIFETLEKRAPMMVVLDREVSGRWTRIRAAAASTASLVRPR